MRWHLEVEKAASTNEFDGNEIQVLGNALTVFPKSSPLGHIYFSLFFFQFEEEEELAIIFLQKVIRGRAIQNMVS